LVAQRAFLRRFRERRRYEFFSLGDATDFDENVGLADKRHERHLQLWHRAGDLERTLVEIDCLLWASEFHIAVPEQCQPSYERRRITIGLGDLDRLEPLRLLLGRPAAPASLPPPA